jgi:hypothetical protein
MLMQNEIQLFGCQPWALGKVFLPNAYDLLPKAYEYLNGYQFCFYFFFVHERQVKLDVWQ